MNTPLSDSEIDFLLLLAAGLSGLWGLLLYGVVLRHGSQKTVMPFLLIAAVLVAVWFFRTH